MKFLGAHAFQFEPLIRNKCCAVHIDCVFMFKIFWIILSCYEKDVWELTFRDSQIHGNRHFADIHIQRYAEYMDLCHCSDNSSGNPFAGLMAHKR